MPIRINLGCRNVAVGSLRGFSAGAVVVVDSVVGVDSAGESASLVAAVAVVPAPSGCGAVWPDSGASVAANGCAVGQRL